jgi:hypothetical protein
MYVTCRKEFAADFKAKKTAMNRLIRTSDKYIPFRTVHEVSLSGLN